VLASDGARRIVIQAVDTPRSRGVEVIRLDVEGGHFAPEAIVRALRAVGLANFLIEGGSYTIAKFIEAGLLDRLHVAVAPLLIGGGPAGLTLFDQPEKLADALRPETRTFSLGSEVVFDCGLSAVAREAVSPAHSKRGTHLG
jgi:riboflavin biosynthesis pyrimidine reductase